MSSTYTAPGGALTVTDFRVSGVEEGFGLEHPLLALARKAERERIIALLKAKEQRTDYRGNGPTFSMSDILRAIEGEQA